MFYIIICALHYVCPTLCLFYHFTLCMLFNICLIIHYVSFSLCVSYITCVYFTLCTPFIMCVLHLCLTFDLLVKVYMLRILSTCTCNYSILALKVAIIIKLHAVIDYWTSRDLVLMSEISHVRDLLAQAVQCLDGETSSGRLESEHTAHSGRLDVDRRPGSSHAVLPLCSFHLGFTPIWCFSLCNGVQ